MKKPDIISIDQELKYLEMAIDMEVLKPKSEWKKILKKFKSAIVNRDILITQLEDKISHKTIDAFAAEYGEGVVKHVSSNGSNVRQKSL